MDRLGLYSYYDICSKHVAKELGDGIAMELILLTKGLTLGTKVLV
jgi:hypothetical protein